MRVPESGADHSGRGVRVKSSAWGMGQRAAAVAVAICAGLSRAGADELTIPGRFKQDISTFLSPSESAYAEVAWSWTPDINFEADGWRFRISSAAGLFRDRNLRLLPLLIPTYYYEASAGYRRRFGDWTTTSWIGLLGVEEAGFSPFQRLGVRLTQQIVWSDSVDYYTGLFLRYESVRNAVSAIANIGFLTPLGFKFGPELGFNLSDAGTGYRYGLAITGVALFGAELGLSAGIGQRERGRPDAYVSAYFHRLF